MGAGSSSINTLDGNPIVEALVSPTPFINLAKAHSNALWNSLDRYPIRLVEADARAWRAGVVRYYNALIQHKETGNFQFLTIQIINKLRSLSANDAASAKALANALTIFNIFFQLLVEQLTPEALVEMFKVSEDIFKFYVPPKDGITLEAFDLKWELVHACVNFLIGTEFNSTTSAVHEAVLEALLLMTATQLFRPLESSQQSDINTEAIKHPFLWLLVNPPPGETLPFASFVEVLLLHIILRRVVAYPKPLSWSSTFSLASKVVMLPFKLPAALFKAVSTKVFPGSSSTDSQAKSENAEASQSLLNWVQTFPQADLACYLLLVLVNYTPPISLATGKPIAYNPYRQALDTFQDRPNYSGATQDQYDVESTYRPNGVFTTPYTKLFDALVARIEEPHTLLLLYFLLHGNNLFRAYVESRSDIDRLIVPLLSVLYNAPLQQPQRIYLILIIILMLTQEPGFGQHVSKIYLKQVSWYKEKSLFDISLDQLIGLTLIHTIQLNLKALKDNQLHMNCLACLANLSTHFESIHPYLALRLVKLFDLLSKKLFSLKEQIAVVQAHIAAIEQAGNEGVRDAYGDVLQQAQTDAGHYEEYLHIALEILTAVLHSKPHSNPNFIYALVYDQKVFGTFTQQASKMISRDTIVPLLSDLINAIEFFNQQIAVIQQPDVDLTHIQVMDAIKNSLFKWKASNPGGKQSDLLFKYEEQNSYEFFTPVIWKVIVSWPQLYWGDPHAIRLFDSSQETSDFARTDLSGVDAATTLPTTNTQTSDVTLDVT